MRTHTGNRGAERRGAVLHYALDVDQQRALDQLDERTQSLQARLAESEERRRRELQSLRVALCDSYDRKIAAWEDIARTGYQERYDRNTANAAAGHSIPIPIQLLLRSRE